MKRKIGSMFLLMILLVSAIVPTAQTKAALPMLFEVLDGANTYVDVTPGSTATISVPVKPVYPTKIQALMAVPQEDAPITTEKVYLVDSRGDSVIGSSTSYVRNESTLSFSIKVKDNAKIGTYYININAQGRYFDSSSSTEEAIKGESVLQVAVRVLSEKAPPQLTIESISYDEDAVLPGEVFDLKLKVRNEGEMSSLSTYLNVEFGESGLAPDYSLESKKLGTLVPDKTIELTLPIKVLSTTTEGLKTLTFKIEGKNTEGTALTFTKNIYIYVQKLPAVVSSSDAKLILSSNFNNIEVKKGEEIDFEVNVRNTGSAKVTNLQVFIRNGLGKENGLIKRYLGEAISLPDLNPKASAKAKLPLVVLNEAPAGVKELEVVVSFKNTDGDFEEASAKFYFTQKVDPEKPTPSPTPTEVPKQTQIQVVGLDQTPSSPQAGSRVAVSLRVTNSGDTIVENFKIGPTNLSSEGLEPVATDPFRIIDSIAPGASEDLTIQLRVGKNAPSGSLPLEMAYTYNSEEGDATAKSETAKLYVIGIQNPEKDGEGASAGKPKLIISDFLTNKKQLRAGESFDFTFDIKNTHTVKSALNIKVTLSQTDNIFSATKGSNSFYISRIAPGEVSQNKINLKVKNDAATNAYDLVVLLEYEYDEMSKVDQEAGGVKEENKIKLQAIEKSRPEVQNIALDTYGEPAIVGSMVSLNFEFFNMGKSKLNNVFFTVTGDFELANNSSMHYYGNMEPGASEFVAPSVVPLVEGEAKGVLVIHFEDSNGDEVTSEKEFTATVVSADSGGMDPGGNLGEEIPGFNPEEQIPVSEPILPLWGFLLIQGGVLVIVLPITYKIIISLKKKKMLKELESESEQN